MSDAPPNSPSLDDLAPLLERAIRADRHRFRRRLRDLQQARRSGRPYDRNLARLAEEVARSVATRERRLAQLPQPTFDDFLPVCQRRDEIAQAIAEHQVVVICGETGSGKSTQLPKICLQLGRGVDGLIGHTQPRRIAARSLATRIAEELRAPLGTTVGYQVRFTDQTGPQTLVKLMTDGILLAETQRDRFLDAYDTLIIDEAHERSLNIDFLMGYLKQLLPRRPDLKLIITSATIDAERFAQHFETTRGPAPVLQVSGRMYPVEVRYHPVAEDDSTDEPDWEQAIVSALHELAEIDTGDTLVFLPTERDIHELAKRLRGEHFAGDGNGRRTEILPLYARLPASEQARVFTGHPYRRIVLATNVAESSLTVPGIRYVVDPGTARISRYSARSKMQRLPIEPISQASANQRSGRCGRMGPGLCIRLYSETDFLARERFTPPEVQRTSLASVILQLKALDFGGIEEFPFLDPPKSEAIRDGYKTLFELGAIDAEQRLTDLGRRLSRLPLDPRVARIVLAGDDEGCLSEILIIAAALELQDPRERPLEKQQAADECHARFSDEESDFFSYLKLWDFYEGLRGSLTRNQLRRACRQNFLSYNRIQEWLDVHRQLLDLVSELGLQPRARRNDRNALTRALLTGLLANVAMKSESGEYQVGGGARAWLWPGSGLLAQKPRWVVASEQVETTRRYLRIAGKIDPGWIERLAAHLVSRSYSDPAWSAERGAVTAFEKVSLWGLPVVPRRQVNYGPIDPQVSREMFIQHGLVEEEWETRGEFRQANRQLAEELKSVESKCRRTGLLRDLTARYEFYDRILPPHVFDGRRFETWRKTVEVDQPRLLHMRPEDLLEENPPEVSAGAFPDRLTLPNLDLPLQYRFEPGETTDGITLTIPMEGLNQLDPRRLGWLVPGLLEEKVSALIKSLPKSVRRMLVPVNETARKVLPQLTFGEGDLQAQLARALTPLAGEAIEPGLFQLDQLPPHLRLNLRVVDSTGRELASGRDLGSLRESLGVAAAQSFSKLPADDGRFQKSGLKEWSFGDLPPSVELSRSGLLLKGYPGLVDEGESVALRLFDAAERAEAETRRGLRRLFVLRESRRLKQQVRALPQVEKWQVLTTGLPAGGPVERQWIDLLAERGLFREAAGVAVGPNTPVGPVPRTATEWQRCLARGVEQLGLAAQDVTELLGPLVQTAHEARKQIDRLGVMPPVQGAKADARQQWGDLLRPGFWTDAPWFWLKQYPRYLRGISLRIDKLLAGGLARDQRGQQQVAGWQAKYQERVQRHQERGLNDLALSEFRWLLEEYRISLFCQELRTVVPVSERRLEESWSRVIE